MDEGEGGQPSTACTVWQPGAPTVGVVVCWLLCRVTSCTSPTWRSLGTWLIPMDTPQSTSTMTCMRSLAIARCVQGVGSAQAYGVSAVSAVCAPFVAGLGGQVPSSRLVGSSSARHRGGDGEPTAILIHCGLCAYQTASKGQALGLYMCREVTLARVYRCKGPNTRPVHFLPVALP